MGTAIGQAGLKPIDKNELLRLLFRGAEEGLNEPFMRLLMLVRAVNEENVLVKKY
jgi:hypothetical protein